MDRKPFSLPGLRSRSVRASASLARDFQPRRSKLVWGEGAGRSTAPATPPAAENWMRRRQRDGHDPQGAALDEKGLGDDIALPYGANNEASCLIEDQ